MQRPITCGVDRSPGQGAAGRACPGWGVESGKCIHMVPPMEATLAGCRVPRGGGGVVAACGNGFWPREQIGYGASTLDLAGAS